MEINICHRIIKQLIQNGKCFLKQPNQFFYSPTCLREIPVGLYSTTTYFKDDIICQLHGKLLLKPSQKTLCVGENMHVVDEFVQHINHSFEPNVKLVLNKLIATTTVEQFDELMLNYDETELYMTHQVKNIDGIETYGKEKKNIIFNE
jgi:hypothetical protein